MLGARWTCARRSHLRSPAENGTKRIASLWRARRHERAAPDRPTERHVELCVGRLELSDTEPRARAAPVRTNEHQLTSIARGDRRLQGVRTSGQQIPGAIVPD